MSFAGLQAHINSSGLGDRITPHAVALSNHNGTGRLRIDKLHSALAKLIDGADGIEVPLKQLDSLDLPPPSVIKIDVEDHEVAVLRGGQRLLTENRPAILFESLRGAPLGATFKPFDFLEGLDFSSMCRLGIWRIKKIAFYKRTSVLNLQNRMPQLALLPFDDTTGFCWATTSTFLLGRGKGRYVMAAHDKLNEGYQHNYRKTCILVEALASSSDANRAGPKWIASTCTIRSNRIKSERPAP